MSMVKFDYHAPDTLEQAVSLLTEHGEAARVMAGGTDLVVKMSHGLLRPKQIISLKKIEGLDSIEFDRQKGARIGAMALLAEVAKHPDILRHYPAVAAAAQNTANVQVRNMGTVVGNLCNASPSADNAPALLCLDAMLNIFGPKGERQTALGEFFQGPGETALTTGEIVTSVTIPPPIPRSGAVYQSLSARGKLDCSAAGVAALLAFDGDICQTARIAVGACAPVPMRVQTAEKLMIGSPLDDGLIQSAARAAGAEVRPITDLRASAEYRWKMVDVLTMRVLFSARKLALR